MNGRGLDFIQTVLFSLSEGVIQSHAAASKQTDDKPGSGSALKIGGVVAVLRPLLPPHINPLKFSVNKDLKEGLGTRC